MSTTYYLLLSALLFSVGAIGVLVRRNAIVVFMCVELMLNAANLAFVTFARMNQSFDGQVIAFFTMVVAALVRDVTADGDGATAGVLDALGQFLGRFGAGVVVDGDGGTGLLGRDVGGLGLDLGPALLQPLNIGADVLFLDAFGRGAEGFARMMGTPAFLVGMTLFCAVWLTWNSLAPESAQFDPRALDETQFQKPALQLHPVRLVMRVTAHLDDDAAVAAVGRLGLRDGGG